jgi:hypothetical protein
MNFPAAADAGAQQAVRPIRASRGSLHMRRDEQRSSRTDMQEGVITRLRCEATITFCFSYQYQRGEVTRATGDGDGKLPNSVLLLALLRAQTLLLLCR